MKKTVHIALCVNDEYIPFACVTIKSIIENNQGDKVNIHLLSDYISDKMRCRLDEVVKKSNSTKLHIHIVNDESLRGLKDTWSIYAWYRIFLPKILPSDIHKVLYLDADTLVVGDIKDLFMLNMEGKAIAGCIDPVSFNNQTFIRCGYESAKRYICTGVLLINLDYWREQNLTDKIIHWAKQNSQNIIFPDQDTINYLCRDSKIILPLQYGIIGCFFQQSQYYQSPFIEELRNAIKSPKIIHYAGQAPWKIELSTHIMQKEWEKYNKMLKHPARRFYITKGLNFVKMKVWKMLHPFQKPTHMTIEEVKQKLNIL